MATTVNVKDVIKSLAPFFESGVRFVSDKTDYSCAFCAVPVTQTDTVALSYTIGRGTWAHVACLTTAGGVLVTDSKVKAKARKLAQDRLKNARTANKTAQTLPPAKTLAESVTLNVDALRAEIEAEYDAVLTDAIETITNLNAQIAALTEQNASLRGALTDKSLNAQGRSDVALAYSKAA